MIQAVFFDIGGTVHTQDATPESDRDYIRRLWCFLHMNHIYTAETPEQLLEHINAGAKAYKSYTEQELIELPPDVIWQKFFLKDFDIPAEKLAGLGEELCYMFDRYRKHIVKREGLKETLEALRQRGYRLGVISNIMSTTFVPRILLSKIFMKSAFCAIQQRKISAEQRLLPRRHQCRPHRRAPSSW